MSLDATRWQELEFDSEMFGFPAGRLELTAGEGEYGPARSRQASLIDRALLDCRAHGIRHLTARVDAGDLPSLHALKAAGFEIIDGIQTFRLDLAGGVEGGQPDGFPVRPFLPRDLDQVVSIARAAYKYDRYHADRALTAEIADNVHEAWMRNSCSGKAADAVLVAVKNDSVLGYVTCKVDGRLGTIVLVATAESARKMGVARATTMGAIRWFRSRGVDAVEVGTQLRNVAAGRLYEGCGFRLAGVSLTLRKVL